MFEDTIITTAQHVIQLLGLATVIFVTAMLTVEVVERLRHMCGATLDLRSSEAGDTEPRSMTLHVGNSLDGQPLPVASGDLTDMAFELTLWFRDGAKALPLQFALQIRMPAAYAQRFSGATIAHRHSGTTLGGAFR